MKEPTRLAKFNLADFELFQSCRAELIEKLDGHKSVMRFHAGNVVYQTGNKPFGVYIVCAGKVKVFMEDSEGRELILRIARPGDLIGYRSLIAHEAYITTAEALEESVLCMIEQDDFHTLIEDEPAFAREMLELSCEEMMEVEKQAFSLGYQPARQRVAQVLLVLNKVYNHTQVPPIINLKRKDISYMAGTTRETTIRLLSEFQKEGLINIEGRKIHVTDVEEITRISMLYD